MYQYCKQEGLLVLYVKTEGSLWALVQRRGTILILSYNEVLKKNYENVWRP